MKEVITKKEVWVKPKIKIVSINKETKGAGIGGLDDNFENTRS